ncbi:ABC transporter permease subunit [Acetatifactor muris]|jgi:putative aldouronate transport system permease protein|uniref:Putative multiple-sugar transport system permease YteP n=1 Tax=Acetatifactor muris TaxID=879566 RepID=A0A2K4ZI88_9FIRM|nr:ABC transporter permease subunit [Acetatifactor muris]MCI8798571.1 sugar ABC transporter permease [Lachnospiraceae bacterium]MCR2048394.1 ABC transporter permease subunit [Acetatifactor muris]SOY30198.1 putative multiple-sugar transport system permease YteP [Acetatifactor muris]
MAALSAKPEKFKKKITAAYVIKRLKESWQLYLLLLPAFIYVVIFSYGPMYGIQIAFKNFKPSIGITESEWLDPLFKNFIRFFKYPDFWKMIRNTLSITLYSLATFPCAIIFALMLNEVRRIRLKKSIQMITYATHFLSEVVACSLVLMMLDRANGPVNNLIAALGGERIPFITNPRAFSSIYVWSDVWQNLGWNSILYIAALASISPELVDAARVDGANRMQIIRHINIPGIMPTIAITFIMRLGGLLSVGYSKIYLLQNDLNLSASQVISTYVYDIGILGGQYSYSTAIGLFNNIVNIICLLIANKVVRRLTETGLF